MKDNGGCTWKREDKERGEREGTCLMYFIYVYENRTMKPVETVLRWG
jgi:hypothetical protein